MCQDIGKIDTRDTKSCCRKPDIEGDNKLQSPYRQKGLYMDKRRKPDIEGDNKAEVNKFEIS